MLSTKQLSDIAALQEEVETYDGLDLKLNWDALRTRKSNQFDFFHYENDRLLAFLGLYAFGSSVEVTGMTAPDERRKGHFTRLFEKAMTFAERVGYREILLNAPASSEAAKEFVKAHGAVYKFTEHQMKWEPRPLPASSGFTLREAEPSDLDMRVRLDVEAFNVSPEDSFAVESSIYGEQDTEMLMIEVNNETIGKIRIQRESGQSWIYGFCILPEHQGKGIGSSVLRHVVKQQSEAGYSVHLEVEAKNALALELYEAVGFTVRHAQDYYEYVR